MRCDISYVVSYSDVDRSVASGSEESCSSSTVVKTIRCSRCESGFAVGRDYRYGYAAAGSGGWGFGDVRNGRSGSIDFCGWGSTGSTVSCGVEDRYRTGLTVAWYRTSVVVGWCKGHVIR